MCRTLLAVLSAALALAPPALAADHLMLVNEVFRGAADDQSFVELVDPSAEPFPSPFYSIAAVDGSGMPFSAQTFGEPQPFQQQTDPFLVGGTGVVPRDATLTMTLPPQSVRVCFYRGAALAPNVINCLDFGASTIPPGQSAQRQSCGLVAAALPTPDQANTETGACSGGGGSGGGGGGGGGTTTPPADLTPPRQRIGLKRRQDVDRLVVTVTLGEPGTVTVKASVNVPRASRLLRFKPVTRSLSADAPVRLRLRLARPARRVVEAALDRGVRLSARVSIVARDRAGNATPQARRRIRLVD
jgi:hypothetical protein